MVTRDTDPLQHPLRFNPIGRDFVWGGCRLQEKYGHLVAGDHLAEVWLLSGHEAGLTPVVAGPLQGQTLPQLLQDFGADLVGTNCGQDFPLLFKLLDVAQWLSVQVHPTSETAAPKEAFGKTELWVTLNACPDAQLLLGMRPGVTPADIAQTGATAKLVDLLQRESVQQGQAFLVPAGTIHALGPGSTMLEIQESSDTTYRMYDWDRPHDPSRPRPVHWQESLGVLDVRGTAPGPVSTRTATWQGHAAEKLAQCRTFEVFRLAQAPGVGLDGVTSACSMEVLVVLQGRARVVAGNQAETVSAWDCVLLPAAMGSFTIQPETHFEYVAVRVPAATSTPHL